MASISSTGIGSGIDVGALVSSLVSAEGASKAARLDSREAQYTAKLSSLSTLKGAVSDFQSSYSSLKSVSTFNALTASSSDTSIFTVSASKGAEASSYGIDVTNLAVAQKLQTSSGYADSNTTSIGTGTLTFSFASDPATTTDVTITDGTLQDIRNSINDADLGVSANIVYDGTDYELVLTSETGLDNKITITQTSTTGNLSAFEYNSGTATGNLTETVAAEDAILTVDGVGITSASNTITTAIENVTLTLTGEGAGETLSISQNTSAVGTAVQSFVDGYNTLVSTLNEASSYVEGGNSGVLIGDSTVRGIVSQLRSILNTTVGDSTTTTYDSFASIGILTKRDGTLEYDASELSTALSANATEVQALLAGGGTASKNSSVSVVSIPDDLAAGSYNFEVKPAMTAGSIVSTTTVAVEPTRYDLSNPIFVRDFTVEVDGVATNTLSFDQTNYYNDNGFDTLLAGQAMAAKIQSEINTDANIVAAGKSVSVSYAEVGGNIQYTMTSDLLGANSALEINFSSHVNARTGLANNVGTPAEGTDIGVDEIGGVAATVSGTRWSGSGSFDGFEIDYTGSDTGIIDTITVEDGLMDRLDNLVSTILDSDGLIDAKTDGLNSSIADITDQRTALNERLASYEARLLKQFNAMDTLVAQLNSTSTFLTNQLSSLSSLANRSNK